MTETRQPTLDELRAQVITGTRKYADTPGTGPEGTTCHSCRHVRYTDPQGRARHPKCGLTNYTRGDATTIKTSTPSCRRYEVDNG